MVNLKIIKGMAATILNGAKRIAKPKNTAYKQYKAIIKEQGKKLETDSGIKYYMEPTSKKILKKRGYSTEALTTLQSSELINEFYKLLASKGYDKPSTLAFIDRMIPEGCGVAGCAMSKDIVWGTTCIKGIDFRIPFHELGHTLTKKLTGWFPGLKSIPYMIKDQKLKKCLNKKEQEIMKADYRRAWDEGYLKHNHWIEEGVRLGRVKNKDVKQWRKHPEEQYLAQALQDRFEFIAEYFNLAVKGFKWSPEMTAKYKKFKGPEIKGIVTEEELQNLEKMRKRIIKKTLSDYGITMNV